MRASDINDVNRIPGAVRARSLNIRFKETRTVVRNLFLIILPLMNFVNKNCFLLN